MTTTDDHLPTTTAYRPRLRERLRLSWWMLRFDVAMQDYPARESRRIRRELRAAVLDDAGRTGFDEALRGLGRPRRLAATYYADLERERPRWADGAVLAGLIGILLPGYMWIAWQMGAFSAIDAMGGGAVDLSWLGVPVTFTHTDDTISMHTTAGWGPVALSGALCLVAFALGSRVWRLWGGAA